MEKRNWGRVSLIIEAFYLFLPAAFSNMAPGIFRKLEFFNSPIDGGRIFLGKRIFGDNKTWKGIISGIIMGVAIAFIQTFLYKFPFFREISVIDYSSISYIILGLAFGLGAHIGDLAESFIKRRLGMKPGTCLIFFDQADWVIGSFIIVSIFNYIGIKMLLIGLGVYFFLHIIVKHIAFYIGTDDNRW